MNCRPVISESVALIEIRKNRIQQGDTGSLVILNFEKIGDGKHGMTFEGLEDSFAQWAAKSE